MPHPDRITGQIIGRWAFVAGVLIGGALVLALGLTPLLTFAAGLVVASIVATASDTRRLRT